MSYQIEVRIFCDMKGCDRVFVVRRINRAGLSGTWAAYLARGDGWQVQGGVTRTSAKKALCPTHATI